MGYTVEELLNRISSRELSEWLAFAGLEPFGVEVDQLGHAITASTIANVNRGKGRKPYDVEDFMPKFEKQNQTQEEMIQLAAMFTGSMGGSDLREEKSDG